MKCHVCLGRDDARKGDVNHYSNKESGLLAGWYHLMCALQVGFNEWDED